MSSIPAGTVESRPTAHPIIPWAARLYRPLEPYAYTLIRVATGAIFIPHGVQKLFLGAAAGPLGYMFGGLELIGGLLILLGVLVRPVALVLIIDVLMVIVANMAKGWLWTRGGVQYHTFLLGMVLAVFLGGAGRHAAGSWIIQRFDELLVPFAYAFARVWFALLILPSGYEKVFSDGATRIAAGNVLKTGFYPPLFWAWVVALLEFVGMILLAAGLFPRPLPLLMAIRLGGVGGAVPMPHRWDWAPRGPEFALILFVVCVAFVLGGGGRYSLDRRLGREF